MADTLDSITNSFSNLTTTFSNGNFTIGTGGGTLTSVTFPGYNIVNNLVKEAKGPQSPFFGWDYTAPRTPPLARGVVNNSGPNLANQFLSHNCGFTLDISSDISGIISALNAIRHPPKNAIAVLIRLAIPNLMNVLRAALTAILSALNFDPSGELSAAYSKLKWYLRKILKLLRFVAKVVALANALVQLQSNLNQLLAYLKSLPAQIAQFFKQCLLNFTSSLQNLISGIQQIPGAVSGSSNTTIAIQGITNSVNALGVAANASYNMASSNVSSSNANTILSTGILTSPDASHAKVIMTYISTNTPNSNVIMSQTYNSANTQSP